MEESGGGRSHVAQPAGVVRAVGRSALLGGLALVEALALLWVTVCVALTPVGIGVGMLPVALAAARTLTDRQRALAAQWSGVPVGRPAPVEVAAGDPAWRRTVRMAGRADTWRDLRWLLVNPVVGATLAFLPAALVVNGIWGVSLPLTWQVMVQSWGWHGLSYGLIPLVDGRSANIAALVGGAEIILGLLLAPALLRLHGHWVRLMLDDATAPSAAPLPHPALT